MNENDIDPANSVDEASSNTASTEQVNTNQTESQGNPFLQKLKSLGGLLGRGIMGVMSDEAPSGPPDARERKALDLPEAPPQQQDEDLPQTTEEK